MNLVISEKPRFPTGHLTTLDMPLDSGFMSGATVQDRSQAGNHGLAVNSPVPSYPGFLFDGTNRGDVGQYIGADDILDGGVYPFTMAVWCKATNAGDDERAVFAIGEDTSRQQATIKTHTVMLFLAIQNGLGKANKGRFTAANSLVANVWNCVVGTHAGTGVTNVNIYQNGALDNDSNADQAAVDLTGVITRWRIGDSANLDAEALEDPWEGNIGDVMFERRVWSAIEAKNFYELTRHRYGV